MVKILLLIAMIYCHIVDDFHIQGVLANMKQKAWWNEHAADDLYRRDYIAALAAHSFSWAAAIHIPCFVYAYVFGYELSAIVPVVIFLTCMIGHAIVDHTKANLHKINLMQDQMIHVIQILLTWFVWAWHIEWLQ